MRSLTNEQMAIVNGSVSSGCWWAIAAMCSSCMSAVFIGNVVGLIGWGIGMGISGGGLVASCKDEGETAA